MSDQNNKPSPIEAIAALAVAPDPAGDESASQPSRHPDEPPPTDEKAVHGRLDDDDMSDGVPSDLFASAADVAPETLRACAALDQSDTDNGKRLRRYFGDDVLVLAEDGSPEGQYLVWKGTHWDIAEGPAEARKLAQRIGGLIGLEADYIEASPRERVAIEQGEQAEYDLKRLLKELPKEKDWSDEQRARVDALENAVAAMKQAQADLKARQVARRRFGVSSKNQARIENMLKAAAPHLRRPAEAFNRDPFLVATLSHTLRFVREPDPECPDPDATRYRWRCDAQPTHERGDLITALVPVQYDAAARPDKWAAFLDRFMPLPAHADKRRTLQQFSGLGLLGLIIQRLMFHYGEGANGKSVYLETLMRLLGDSFAVSLPPETLIGGGDRNAGGAAPDIMRMFGKRMLRVPEIKPGAALQEDLVKRITGGEKLTARTLFKGYIDFQNKAKPHMSGNGFPKIDGTDHGIKRRILVVHWTETIAEADQKDFEEVVKGLLSEAPAILNWLIEGALDYLNNGLFIAEDIRAATQDYFDEMDTVGQFVRDCVEIVEGQSVTAREMYEAYKAWCAANAKTPVLETRFGRVMKGKIKREEKRIRRYLNVRLHDVPSVSGRAEAPPHPADADELVPL